MPLAACDTGASRTTSAGVRVIAWDACDMNGDCNAIRPVRSRSRCPVLLVIPAGATASAAERRDLHFPRLRLDRRTPRRCTLVSNVVKLHDPAPATQPALHLPDLDRARA